jgi:preprotein translocase subunit SecA
MGWLKNIFKRDASANWQRFEPLVAAVAKLEPEMKQLADADFPLTTAKLKARLAAGANLDDLVPEAFALVREAARRTLGQRHFDVQLAGGFTLHQGQIAEMRTGEGKTLVATLAAFLNALAGQGVHLVTVNDYLARRDATWMGQIYAFLGLAVGVLNHQSSFLYDAGHSEVDAARDAEGSFRVFYQFLRPVERAAAYGADITYGTNHEFGFDYLRDHLARTPAEVVASRGYHYAIIDEVDSILIDEARTPLIISAPSGDPENLYGLFAKIAQKLAADTDYTVDEKSKSIALTEEGINHAEKLLGVGDIYSEKGIRYVHHLETAVRARALYLRDRDYVVTKEGEVVIVDEFTGRLQPGRRWSEGLHQAVEAKEGVRVQEESRTLASVTFQNYFKLYKKISGMTGTALTSAEEFRRVYGLETVAIPTNRPSQRRDENDLVFQTEAGKIRAVARRVKELYQSGQPVLVGTASIEKNQLVSAALSREGVPHQVLNAKNHEAEGTIIAGAGQPRSVVVATNLAGRGVDIKLGEGVREKGGLFVLGTERHEARRIDNQLRGRAGRQGDPGATQFYISLEDSLARIFAGDRLKRMMGRFGVPEDEPLTHRLVSRAIENAQTKIEGLNFDLRKHLLDYDDVLNHQRSLVYNRRQKLLFGGPEAVETFLADWPSETLPTLAHDLAEAQKAALRPALLQLLDLLWMEQLDALDHLRNSVRLRAYGQRDPLIEYKREGLAMFKDLGERLATEAEKLILKLKETPSLELKTEAGQPLSRVESHPLAAGFNPLETSPSPQPASSSVVNQGPKIGRNDLCPCGSGLKYKKCGLINAPEHKAN